MSAVGSPNIRILIVDDNKVTVDNVARLLNFEPDMQVVGSAPNGREGVRLAHELRPDVVLMDINMPDMDGIEACRQIVQQSPRSRVMMMSVQSDMAYFKQAMNAGAREFLTKPFDLDELVNSIRRVAAADPAQAERAAEVRPAPVPGVEGVVEVPPVGLRGVVVAVFSPKGGAGCSTVAANLSIILSGSRQANVLLVDADLYFGDQDALLDLQPAHRVTDVIEMYDPDDPDLIEKMLSQHDSGVWLLPAPARPELAELVRPEWLRSVLETLRKRHDYIVVDLGSRSDEVTRQVLSLADRVVMLVTPEVAAIKNVNLFLNMDGPKSYPPEKVVVVLNKYNHAWGFTAETVGKAIGRAVSLVVPSDDTVALEAVNRGRPAILAAPRSAMSRRLLALEKLIPDREGLAEERREILRQQASTPPPPIVLTTPAVTPAASTDVQPVPEAAQVPRPVQEERRGCSRWLPFLKRRSR